MLFYRRGVTPEAPNRTTTDVKTIDLPRWLEPEGDFILIRLGRDRDGGYLVESRDVYAADSLISLGISDDWSFEESFLERRDVPLHAFDGTIRRGFVDSGILALKFLKAVALRNQIKYRYKAWREFNQFFTGTRQYHSEMVGLGNTPGWLTLREVLNTYTPEGKVFLKIDIEGWEYRLFDDLMTEADRICGLVIEFHDIDLHYALLAEFVARIPLNVAHVHYNSFAPVSDQGVPLVLEVTFSSHASVASNKVKLPHALDRLSDPSHQPYEIRFVD